MPLSFDGDSCPYPARAKHYLADTDDFLKTARYWTETYANGSESARPPDASAESGTEANAEAGNNDDAKRAGLKPEHVEQFCNMVSKIIIKGETDNSSSPFRRFYKGFERARVIEVLKKVNYRGAK